MTRMQTLIGVVSSMSPGHSGRRPLPPEWPIAAWGFALNAVWEFAQSPLYADWNRSIGYLIATRLHCTVEDVLILLAAFWGTSLLFRTRHWIQGLTFGAGASFVSIGFLFTVWSEWSATGVRAAWHYSSAMPTLAGLGLAPLLQWLIIPPLILMVVRHSLISRRAS